jgi:hypothetical protein
MQKIIKAVLDDLAEGQINLGSNAARKTIADLITVALKTRGIYTAVGKKEDQKAIDSWVCEICGKNTWDVDCDYIGSGTNHLGCELSDDASQLLNLVKK